MAVTYLNAGQTVTNAGYYVPPARMQWIMRQLSAKQMTNSTTK
jgi:hypothetical protein